MPEAWSLLDEGEAGGLHHEHRDVPDQPRAGDRVQWVDTPRDAQRIARYAVEAGRCDVVLAPGSDPRAAQRLVEPGVELRGELLVGPALVHAAVLVDDQYAAARHRGGEDPVGDGERLVEPLVLARSRPPCVRHHCYAGAHGDTR
jgi:hypothetical protein